jgi:NADPH:quinone reductase-like Zn-dependent oxidoreductase
MKALVIQDGFGLENLRMAERPEPIPGSKQLLVRVRAASLNYRDLLIARGQYNPRLQLPRVPGSDAAGEVVSIGEAVTKFRPHDRVVGCFMPLWQDGAIDESVARYTPGNEYDGVFSELVVLEEQATLPIPADLSFEEAATLPCAGVTAWNALTLGHCGPGKTVLLQGTGGVSIFALQLAKALGARTLITSSQDHKLQRARALGADVGLNYQVHPDWEKWARQQSDGKGVDLVIEVGGAGTLERSIKAVRYGGRIALIGVLAGAGSFNPLSILMKAVDLQGVFVGSRTMFEEFNRFIATHQIRPIIDRVFPFNNALEAFHYFESGSHFGKVVLSFS